MDDEHYLLDAILKNHTSISRSVLTKPATAAVAVAMAGIIFPAMRLVLSLSAGSMEYMMALREDADATKSMWPLLSSSFSNWSGLIRNRSAQFTGHTLQSLITNVTLQLSCFQFVSQLVSPSDVKKKKKDMLSICIPGVTLSVAIACSKWVMASLSSSLLRGIFIWSGFLAVSSVSMHW